MLTTGEGHARPLLLMSAGQHCPVEAQPRCCCRRWCAPARRRLEVLLQRLGVHQGVRPSQGRHPSKGSSPTSSSSTPSHPVPKPASSRRERHQLLRAGLPTVLLLRSQALDEAVQPMDRCGAPRAWGFGQR